MSAFQATQGVAGTSDPANSTSKRSARRVRWCATGATNRASAAGPTSTQGRRKLPAGDPLPLVAKKLNGYNSC